MKFEEVIKIMTDLNVMHIKVLDTNGKRVIDFTDEQSTENTVNRLKEYLPILSGYGRVTFIGGTENIKKANYKDAYNWVVTFNGSNDVSTQNNANHQNNNNYTPKGFVSANEANLMAQLQVLTMQMSFQKQIADLEKKFSLPTAEPDMIDKYLPMLGMFVDIDDKKIANVMKLAQMQGMAKGTPQLPAQTQSTGMAGTFTGTTKDGTKVEITEQEKVQIDTFNKEIDLLSEKASLEKLTELVKALNSNPAFIEQALVFMNLNKQTT